MDEIYQSADMNKLKFLKSFFKLDFSQLNVLYDCMLTFYNHITPIIYLRFYNSLVRGFFFYLACTHAGVSFTWVVWYATAEFGFTCEMLKLFN